MSDASATVRWYRLGTLTNAKVEPRPTHLKKFTVALLAFAVLITAGSCRADAR